MKKILSSIIMLCIVWTSFAQQIQKDYITAKNKRTILCSDEVCRNFTDRIVLSMSLNAVKEQTKDLQYFLSLSFQEIASVREDFSIPKRAKLLIRTKDEAVLELECGSGDEDFFGDLVRIGNTLVNMKKVTAIAYISPEDVSHLCTGIIKIRCELNSAQLDQSYYENSFKKAKLADVFSTEKRIIDNALKETRSGNINDGF